VTCYDFVQAFQGSFQRPTNIIKRAARNVAVTSADLFLDYLMTLLQIHRLYST